MDVLNFSSYANAFKLGVIIESEIDITNALLGFIIESPNVYKKGTEEPYILSSQIISPWWNQVEDIPGNIKKAATRIDISSKADSYFDETVYPLLSGLKEQLTYNALTDLIEKQEMADTERDRLMNLYNDGTYSEFLAQTFLHAIQNKGNITKNKKRTQPASVRQDLETLNTILARYPRPVIIVPPDDLEDIEMIYVQELLAAYADAEDVEVMTREDLDSYKQYKRDFTNNRKYFFAAESIQRSLRDTVLPDEYKDFDSLKTETLDAIEPVKNRYYSNGYERLSKVMEHASLLRLNKSMLTTLPGWIGAREQMGICHMLVNENNFRWVDDDE